MLSCSAAIRSSEERSDQHGNGHRRERHTGPAIAQREEHDSRNEQSEREGQGLAELG
jgi:hypothetical protein